MRRALVALLVVSACAEPVQPTAAQLIGEWEKTDDKLPPVSLLFTAQGSTVQGRMRLSGAEDTGVATLEGSQLRLTFPSGRAPLIGELAPPELRVRVGPSGETYTLHKK